MWQCGLHNASDNALRFVKENFLADDSVRPVARSLTMVSAEHSYSHLTVQRVQAANNRDYTILFLLTGKHTTLTHYVLLFYEGLNQ